MLSANKIMSQDDNEATTTKQTPSTDEDLEEAKVKIILSNLSRYDANTVC